MRVVLDTNVVVSAFLSTRGNPAEIVGAWEEESLDVVLSDQLIEEYKRTLSYPRVARRHGMDHMQIAEVVQGLRKIGVLVEVDEIPPVVADDPDDDLIIATAVAGRASYIVTGDNHLLQLEKHGSIEILTPAAFLLVLASDSPG